MKRFLLTLLLVNITLGVLAQTDFFYSLDGKKEHFTIRKNKIIIKAKSSISRQKILQQPMLKSTNIIYDNFLITTIDSATTKINELLKNDDIADAYYVLEHADGTLQSPTNKIFVKPLKEVSIKNIILKNGLSTKIEALNLINSIENIYMLTLDIKMKDVLLLCRSLYETGTVEFAEPSFLREINLYNTNYSNQWGLKNTGQSGGTPGIDINIENAWNITRGNGITVAVLDEGIDLTHPDLSANLITGYDATGGSGNGAPQGDEAHGTACAGIIGAVNNTIGIVGVASSSHILPVRIAYTHYVNGQKRWTEDSWAVNGIYHAWSTGADVLSNSWGGGSSSLTVNAEIQNAVTQGRNGKGCVVVFASGNDNASSVNYPANLSNVIAVGAISPCGERKSPSSCDGETWWGSNYGTNLDVVALGVDIYTTDIQEN
jgi:subtilisin family serine protease